MKWDRWIRCAGGEGDEDDEDDDDRSIFAVNEVRPLIKTLLVMVSAADVWVRHIEILRRMKRVTNKCWNFPMGVRG